MDYCWGELGNAVFIAMWILIEKKQNNKRLPMPGNLFVSGSVLLSRILSVSLKSDHSEEHTSI